MTDDEKKKRGPKPVHGDRIMLRLPPALLQRVDRVAGEKLRSDFIREAIDRELTRRERTAAKPKP